MSGCESGFANGSILRQLGWRKEYAGAAWIVLFFSHRGGRAASRASGTEHLVRRSLLLFR